MCTNFFLLLMHKNRICILLHIFNLNLLLFIITRLTMILYNADDEDDDDSDVEEHTKPALLFAESNARAFAV